MSREEQILNTTKDDAIKIAKLLTRGLVTVEEAARRMTKCAELIRAVSVYKALSEGENI
jgi:hypothetical protein